MAALDLNLALEAYILRDPIKVHHKLDDILLNQEKKPEILL